ncbi:hypothetical protein [Actinomycetospora atypica]|uniref:Uncharacterized protein n=1 Tax=Actinomycetospora atypica TaxID=1290095 RepID=A0ABV9YNP5_9PSEU
MTENDPPTTPSQSAVGPTPTRWQRMRTATASRAPRGRAGTVLVGVGGFVLGLIVAGALLLATPLGGGHGGDGPRADRLASQGADGGPGRGGPDGGPGRGGPGHGGPGRGGPEGGPGRGAGAAGGPVIKVQPGGTVIVQPGATVTQPGAQAPAVPGAPAAPAPGAPAPAAPAVPNGQAPVAPAPVAPAPAAPAPAPAG